MIIGNLFLTTGILLIFAAFVTLSFQQIAIIIKINPQKKWGSLILNCLIFLFMSFILLAFIMGTGWLAGYAFFLIPAILGLLIYRLKPETIVNVTHDSRGRGWGGGSLYKTYGLRLINKRLEFWIDLLPYLLFIISGLFIAAGIVTIGIAGS